ncbi:sulfotransferase [Aestuariicella sp. G3-2]|uniref:sulfotransferase family protein n=1 Tax=Pseudomaricurvus albidus TaxID=2842452 RepID=UPI001C0CFF5B|nr:sulfotransferase [Aestuariicella albida]MBU3070887.1 sulfotransferase [Aestuariicella albida]
MNTPLVFIVGTQRSGSTWLQSLMSSYSGIVTAQETGCFSNYLFFLDRQWSFEISKYEERGVGLTHLFDRNEFIGLCRQFSDSVLMKISDGCERIPDYILEKTPHNAFVLDFILEIYPKAHVIHLVRDPRSVCASLKAANKGWGKAWAPSSSIPASRLWEKSNSAVMNSNSSNIYRVFYEDLRIDTRQELKKIYNWLGLKVEDCEVDRIVELNDIENLKKTRKTSFDDTVEPEDFFRSGKISGWKDELSKSDIRIIEYLCKGLMEDFGYQFSMNAYKKPFRLMARESFEALEWRIKKLSHKVIGSI